MNQQRTFLEFYPPLKAAIAQASQLTVTQRAFFAELLDAIEGCHYQEFALTREAPPPLPLEREELFYPHSLTQLIKEAEGELPKVKLVFTGYIGDFYLRLIELWGKEERVLSALTIVENALPSSSSKASMVKGEWFNSLTNTNDTPLGLWLFAQETQRSSFCYSAYDGEKDFITRGRSFYFSSPDEEANLAHASDVLDTVGVSAVVDADANAKTQALEAKKDEVLILFERLDLKKYRSLFTKERA